MRKRDHVVLDQIALPSSASLMTRFRRLPSESYFCAEEAVVGLPSGTALGQGRAHGPLETSEGEKDASKAIEERVSPGDR